jgi:hypothetical protein
MKQKMLFLVGMFFFVLSANYGQTDENNLKLLKNLQSKIESNDHRYDILKKKIDDVNVLEVESLIKALKAENKKFEYEIFKDIPGGHSFDRIDPKQSREIRLKIWMFLAKYLEPPKPMKTLKEMEKVAYVVIP